MWYRKGSRGRGRGGKGKRKGGRRRVMIHIRETSGPAQGNEAKVETQTEDCASRAKERRVRAA